MAEGNVDDTNTTNDDDDDQPFTPWAVSVASGHTLLRSPQHNKGLAFTDKERFSFLAWPFAVCLPVTIDVGTKNETLLNDEFYTGLKQKRVTGEEYDELLDEFMTAVKKNYGEKVLIRKLEDGDIVNVDISLYYEGVHGDLNETFFVGNVDEASQQLVKCTYECLEKAIAIVKLGVRFLEIGEIINRHVTMSGLSVVKSYCGHGIGDLFHCAPNIPHYASILQIAFHIQHNIIGCVA